MLAAILLGMGIGLLVGLVIVIGKMTIQAIIGRVKKKHAAKLAMARAKKVMADVLNAQAEDKAQQEAISLTDLESLLGAEGCVEYTINDEGKVNPDDIQILQADEMEPKLQALFEQHGDELLLTA